MPREAQTGPPAAQTGQAGHTAQTEHTGQAGQTATRRPKTRPERRTATRHKARRAVYLGLGLALTLGFGWLAIRDLDRSALVAAVAEVRVSWLPLAVLAVLAGYLCRVVRWRVMLRASGLKVGLGRAAVPLLASIALNNLLPLRAGDVVRCTGFTRWLGADAGTITATVLVERLLDLLAVVIALGLALALLAPAGARHGLLGASGGGVTVIALGGAALVLLLVPALLRVPLRLLDAGLRSLSAHWANAFAGFTAPLLATVERLAGSRAMLALLGWSALAWLAEGATYWTVARALPSVVAPVAGWLAMPVATLATLLPSTPGHIGTFDYFAIQAARASGNPLAAAATFAVLVHAVLYLTTTMAGGICLLLWRLQPAPRRLACP